MLNGSASKYLQTLVPPVVHNTTSPNLIKILTIFVTFVPALTYFTTHFFHLQFEHGMSLLTKSRPLLWSLPLNYVHKPPKYFNSGTRKGQILHARLRMECRSLNAHLYKKNNEPSPSCSCGGFESTYHFSFKCPNYSLIRT